MFGVERTSAAKGFDRCLNFKVSACAVPVRACVYNSPFLIDFNLIKHLLKENTQKASRCSKELLLPSLLQRGKSHPLPVPGDILVNGNGPSPAQVIVIINVALYTTNEFQQEGPCVPVYGSFMHRLFQISIRVSSVDKRDCSKYSKVN